MKKLTSLLLVLTMIFSSGFSSFAAENETVANNMFIESNKGIYNSSLDNYGMVSSGYLEVNPDGSVRITDKYIDYVQNKMEENGIEATVSANENTITIVENTPALYASSASSASSGVTKVKWLSFNRFEIYLDNNLSTKVAAGAGIGGALSMWIPDPVVSKVVATALYLSAGLIAYNNEGRGVVISGIYLLGPVPTATFYWIKPQ